MTQPYSKRNRPPRDSFTYELPKLVRSRIMHTLEQGLEADSRRIGYSLENILEEVGRRCLTEYGGMLEDMHSGVSLRRKTYAEQAYEHFFQCSDEHALDFLEFYFQVGPFYHAPGGPEAINAILQDEGIGYEMTPFREIEGEWSSEDGRQYDYEFPVFIKKSGEYLHKEVIRPCLEALGHPSLQHAHGEMMKAHGAYRKGEYADAITDAGAALESVFKTICTVKGWAFNPNKDTLSDLVRICKDQGLFYPFYDPIFVSAGTIRNKLSDAHGRGPAPLHPVSKEHADHMLQTTSAHITLLVKLANL